MESTKPKVGFRIWGADNVVYGPAELPELVSWVKEQRVLDRTWVYSELDKCWRQAAQVPELRMFFHSGSGAGAGARSVGHPASFVPAPQSDAARADSGVSDETSMMARTPQSLRRVRVFSQFSDLQLQRFVQFMEVQRVRQFTEVVKQGEHGEAMYMVLDGELRVRLMVSNKESTLVTVNPGEFFGEVSLFDHGPRSADVVANQDSLLLKISAKSFQRLLEEAPDLAAPFLFAMSKTLTARIRADNKRYRDSISFARAAGK
jgi:hypothetical protein